MEHRDDEATPLAGESRGPVPDDMPLGGVAGPEDENAPPRPLHSDGEDGPREPTPPDAPDA